MAAEDSAHGLACGDEPFAAIVDALSESAFSKEAITKTVCQNFVFSAEQVAEMLKQFSFDSDKKEAVPLFRTSVTNPDEADPILDLFDGDDRDEVAAMLADFSKAEAREIADYPIEDDGTRSDEDMERFLAAIRDASFSDDKVAIAESETVEHPSPPFNCDQLVSVLKEFSFSDDAMRVLEAFTGPQIVYPLSCEEINTVLEVFSMSSDKLKVLPHLKAFIKDAQNKMTIVTGFDFSDDKASAEEILRDVVVDFRPKTPPMAAIQEALRRVGRCPAGYDWRKVGGGWRCAAGGHYVSDATLEASM